MRRSTGILAGIATLAIGAVGALILNEKRIEQPRYRILASDGRFELREYAPILMAETVCSGERESALTAGFRRLAGYIFAKDRGGAAIAMTAPVIQRQAEKIAMTAPVTQTRGDGAGEWAVHFVMPTEYSRASLPPPPAGVTIVEVPARKMAVLRFSGATGDVRLATRLAELDGWLTARRLRGVGEPEYAFYNSPFVPLPLRRNEVMREYSEV